MAYSKSSSNLESKLDSQNSVDIEGIGYLSQQDFSKRRTLPCYEFARQIEDLLLNMPLKNHQVETRLILPGLVYGLGEEDFQYLFSGLTEQKSLCIFGSGDNHVSTIHVKDLIYCILKTLLNFSCPQIQFCVDSQKMTQKEIIDKISTKFDLPSPRVRSDLESVFDPLYLPMTIDLKLQSSFDIQSKENDIRLESSSDQWHCPMGLVESIQQVMDEYVEYREIKPVRMIIYGPESLLTQIGFREQLSERLQLTIITQENLIQSIARVSQENLKISQKIRTLLEQFSLKQKELILQQQLIEYQKNKKKFSSEPKLEEIEFDPFGSLDIEIILEYLLWLINQPSIKYRGFILDGFPQNLWQGQRLLERLVESGSNEKFDAVFYLRPDWQRMTEEIKRHQKFGNKDPTQLLPVEKLDFYEGFMNYEDVYASLMDYFRVNQERVVELCFNSPRILTQKIIDFLIDSKDQVLVDFQENGAPKEALLIPEVEQFKAQNISKLNSAVNFS